MNAINKFGFFLGLIALLLGCAKKPECPSVEPTHQDETESHPGLPTRVRLSKEVLSSAKIRSEPVQVQALLATVELSGEIQADPDRTAQVTARVPGRITEVRFQEGMRVKAGDLLVTMESSELSRIRSTLLSSQARSQAAGKNLRRLQNLSKTGLAADQEVVAARAEVNSLHADALAAERALLSFGLTKGQLTQSGSKLEVRAPREGVIVSRNAIVGQAVPADHLLTEVMDLEKAFFVGRLFEKDLAYVRVGERADIRLNGYPTEVFAGTVEMIGNRLDPAARTVTARIAVTNHHDLLKVGLFGKAQVTQSQGKPQASGLVIPLTAVTPLAGEQVVFVHHPDNDFEVHPVKLGASADGKVMVLSGLKEGEQVVVEGVFTLKSMVLKSSMEEGE